MRSILRTPSAEVTVGFSADMEAGYDCGDFSLRVGDFKLRIRLPGPHRDQEEALEAWERLREALLAAVKDCDATIIELGRAVEERRRDTAGRVAEGELQGVARREPLEMAVTDGGEAGEVAD